MSVTDYSEVDPPETDEIPNNDFLTCESCNTSFEHSGRGRKPKRCPDCRKSGPTTSRAKSPAGDVKSALAVLDGMYSAVSLGLFMLSPNAAASWAAQIDQLQASNAVTLAGDKVLCKSITKMGERTGKAMFFGAHVVAFAPVVNELRKDFANRTKKTKHEPTPANPSPDISADRSPVYGNQEFFG